MDFFFKDIEHSIHKTWNCLIDDIRNTSTYNTYCKSENYYDVFKHIISSIILENEIILLDSDFTDSEILNYIEVSDIEQFSKTINKKHIVFPTSKEELLKILQTPSSNWKITLFTSGTTGTPKKVTHDFNSITRFVKLSNLNTKNIWGFAYNPTHMAGLQVFFQAILNGNPIVRLFGLNTSDILNEIKENKITNISATPTFYRLLLPCAESFPLVTRITSGGEKFSPQIISQLNNTFPNAKISNIYASTEAGTLFASENDVFTIKPEYEHLIRIENDELLIHSNLMGIWEKNTKEWYCTNDLVDIISITPLKFRFISRKSEMINVGGYKVNPLEVEERILSIKGIKNVRVFAKSNSILGNIVCCEVVSENKQISESSIRTYLQSKLQEFKIPRIIRFVDELSTTRTGKVKRT